MINNQLTQQQLDIHTLAVNFTKELNQSSKEKYETKKNLIENASDMSTKEKIEYLDKNFDQRNNEVIEILFKFTLFSLGALGVGYGTTKIIQVFPPLRKTNFA